MDNKRLEKIKEIKDKQKLKTKDKEFKKLSTKEKDELLETVCKMLGLIQ